jgi:hypothetical protein
MPRLSCPELLTSETAVGETTDNNNELEKRARASEDRLQFAEAASGIATFDFDVQSENWNWSPQATSLFGLDAIALDGWERTVFVDDLPKLRAAVQTAIETGRFYTEFRVRHVDQGLRWIAGRGQVASVGAPPRTFVRGALYEITDRKALEARLLAVNETLEARVAEARQETRALEVLNQVGIAVAAEHDLERLVQAVTDAGVELSHAEFGAFFYNVLREGGEAYTLYTLSGAPPEAFSKFPMPRNTAIFEPTFRGRPPVRSDDILADPWDAKRPPPGTKLSRSFGNISIWRSAGRTFLRSWAAWSLYRACPADCGGFGSPSRGCYR